MQALCLVTKLGFISVDTRTLGITANGLQKVSPILVHQVLYMQTLVKQPTPHSAHSLPADSPTSQQSQQDRKR